MGGGLLVWVLEPEVGAADAVSNATSLKESIQKCSEYDYLLLWVIKYYLTCSVFLKSKHCSLCFIHFLTFNYQNFCKR